MADLPEGPLTVAQVERLWKNDRVRAVAMQRCGHRLMQWYDDLRGRWR